MVTVVVVVVVNVCRLRKRWLFAIRQYVHYKSAFSVPRCLCAIPKYQYSITATSYPMITTNKNVIVISSKCTATETESVCLFAEEGDGRPVETLSNVNCSHLER